MTRTIRLSVILALLALAIPLQTALATHTSGQRTGSVNCYTWGYIESKASNLVEHVWSGGGYDVWYNSSNTVRRSSPIPNVYYSIFFDHQIISYRDYCNS